MTDHCGSRVGDAVTGGTLSTQVEHRLIGSGLWEAPRPLLQQHIES